MLCLFQVLLTHKNQILPTTTAEGFFYETVAPILSIGTASLVAISTLTSEIVNLAQKSVLF